MVIELENIFPVPRYCPWDDSLERKASGGMAGVYQKQGSNTVHKVTAIGKSHSLKNRKKPLGKVSVEYKGGGEILIEEAKFINRDNSASYWLLQSVAHEIDAFQEIERNRRFCDPLNIVPHYHDHFFYVDTSGTLYCAIELTALSGQDIAALLQQDRQNLSLDDKLKILYDVGTCLVRVHQIGFYHQDIKPQNVHFGTHQRVGLFDFNLARRVERKTELDGPLDLLLDEYRFEERIIHGTLCYIAPEQARCEQPDTAADIFGWGLLGYELLTGKRFFDGTSPSTILRRIAFFSERNVWQAETEIKNNLMKETDSEFAFYFSLALGKAIRPQPEEREFITALELLEERALPGKKPYLSAAHKSAYSTTIPGLPGRADLAFG